MKAVRIISAALALVMLLLAAGCGGKKAGKEENTAPSNAAVEKKVTYSISLPLAVNDTLNPYYAESDINRALLPLLYDGLVYIDTNFMPQMLIAQRIDINENVLKVMLNPNAKFSDGSAVSATDVVYSFNFAKDSDYYSARLSNFDSVLASGEMVFFNLENADVKAASCLDFPIIKRDSAEVDEDTEIDSLKDHPVPIGSGRFKLEGEPPKAKLVSTGTSLRGKSTVETVELYQVNNSQGMIYGLEVGNYDFWYDDLSDGSYHRANAGMKDVPTNNLIYLGFSDEMKIFEDITVRNAVSLAIDREEITSQCFLGHAIPSVLPFNPKWAEMSKVKTDASTKADTKEALSLLEADGYTLINSYGYRSTVSLSLTANLLICSGNEFKENVAKEIKNYLAKLNFNVNIVRLEYDEYVKAVDKGEYDMYLGEIKIPANMSLDTFFVKGGAGYTGVNTGCNWSACRDGSITLNEFCTSFEGDTPFVPICYRCGSAVSSRQLTSDVISTCYDGFYNINDWVITVSEVLE